MHERMSFVRLLLALQYLTIVHTAVLCVGRPDHVKKGHSHDFVSGQNLGSHSVRCCAPVHEPRL
jgi:hypothetical protein